MIGTENYFTFLLILVRIASYLFTMPVFSMRQISSVVKLAVVWVISVITLSTLPDQSIVVNSLIEFGFMVIQEVCLGLVLGYVSMIIFLGIQSAGDLIDFTAGLKMSASYDPITGTSSSLYSSLYNWIAVILFFNLNGHHYLLKGIVNSFYFLELGQEYLHLLKVESFIYLISRFFLISIQLALPVAIVLFLVDIILGMISKVIPQINVFLLGMPAKIAVSFLIHLFLIVGVIQSISWALDSVMSTLDYFVKTLV